MISDDSWTNVYMLRSCLFLPPLALPGYLSLSPGDNGFFFFWKTDISMFVLIGLYDLVRLGRSVDRLILD
jgi:hypothetical protein